MGVRSLRWNQALRGSSRGSPGGGAMRGPRAVGIQVSPAQQDALRGLQRQQTADQRLVRRASIILALAANPCVEAVARQLGLTRVTVRHWRDRWLTATPDLQRAEQDQPSPQLRR